LDHDKDFMVEVGNAARVLAAVKGMRSGKAPARLGFESPRPK
jgi:hypothetical protein